MSKVTIEHSKQLLAQQNAEFVKNNDFYTQNKILNKMRIDR
jgi:hypothetical protein